MASDEFALLQLMQQAVNAMEPILQMSDRPRFSMNILIQVQALLRLALRGDITPNDKQQSNAARKKFRSDLERLKKFTRETLFGKPSRINTKSILLLLTFNFKFVRYCFAIAKFQSIVEKVISATTAVAAEGGASPVNHPLPSQQQFFSRITSRISSLNEVAQRQSELSSMTS